MGTNLRDGNVDKMGVVQLSINPASVASNSVVEQTFTVLGLRVGDQVMLTKPTVTPGFGIIQARVSATDTLAVQFANVTGSSIDPSVQTNYTLIWFRPTPGTALPGAVQG